MPLKSIYKHVRRIIMSQSELHKAFYYFHLVELEGKPAPENFCLPGDIVAKDSPLSDAVWQ